MVHLRRFVPLLLVLTGVILIQGASNLVHNPHFTGSWSGSNSGINGGWSSLDSMSNVSSIRFLDLDVAYASPDTSGNALLAITNAEGGSATSVVASVYPLYSNAGSPYFGQPMTTNAVSATTTNWEYQWTAQAGADAYYIVATLNGAASYTSVAPATTKIVLTNFGGEEITADRWRLTTNALESVAPETNWWAVFNIVDPAGWANTGQTFLSDITIKCQTNGAWHGSTEVPIFRYTTTDPALNGTPAWENFTTNWYPRAFFYHTHATYGMDWATETRCLDPVTADSIGDTIAGWDGADSSSFPHCWVIMIRDTRQFFHPTNNLHWFFTVYGPTTAPRMIARDGATLLGTDVWWPVVPMWVNYDPRPKVIQEKNATGGQEYIILTPHQKP